jgi:hypothetical protein
MRGGKRIAKQQGCTTSIESTQNNWIHGTQFGPNMTFTRLSHLATKRKPELINIWGMDWTTSQWNHSIQQITFETSSLHELWGSAMTAGLMVTHISSEHYNAGIFSNLSISFWHINNFRCTSILNRCTSLTRRIFESAGRCTWAIGGGIHKINFLPKWRLSQSYVHPSRLTWTRFRVISMPGRWILQFVMFEKVSSAHHKSALGFLLDTSQVPLKGAKNIDKVWHFAVGTVLF